MRNSEENVHRKRNKILFHLQKADLRKQIIHLTLTNRMENVYVNLMNYDIEKEAFEIVCDSYNNNPEAMIHFLIDTNGGNLHHAKAMMQVIRNEKHRTRMHFIDECASVGVYLLQFAIQEGIANVVFPLVILVHQARCEVEMCGPGEYVSENDNQLVRETGIINAEVKLQPMYKALTSAQKHAYNKGQDVVMTTPQTKEYLNRLTELINKTVSSAGKR